MIRLDDAGLLTVGPQGPQHEVGVDDSWLTAEVCMSKNTASILENTLKMSLGLSKETQHHCSKKSNTLTPESALVFTLSNATESRLAICSVGMCWCSYTR